MTNSNLQLIDTHAHLYMDDFIDNIDEFIERAKENNVNKILMPNIDLNSIKPMISISNKYVNTCYHMLGLHPCYIEDDYKTIIKKILSNISKSTIAIGEIGIDLYHRNDNLRDQVSALNIQCKFAQDNNLPVVLHTRKSIDETINVISNYKYKLKGVFHCFDGTYDQALKIIDLGFKIGIGGIITFKNSKLRDIISRISLKNIILETDSPYLSPEPNRGKKNEPCNVLLVANVLSEIFLTPYNNVCKLTSENAINLFDLH
ncbi:MAG: TatD family deoxyribonuclease [Flammeovirgaceae bacterium TMED290]|nr:MAG: TatD family deoxyribonuclease [Flammeovirgaceae bacterium TMED290]|tara:strand:- start:8315 stop:9094 length:780 start_codon:yes stop_codon:yes gene_type:complete